MTAITINDQYSNKNKKELNTKLKLYASYVIFFITSDRMTLKVSKCCLVAKMMSFRKFVTVIFCKL